MPQFTNRLAGESSPYLQQHAHNPVDWYPWGEEAFETARRTGKPILLSIGYSSCHWCHVMERESFEDEEIARLMNAYFVNIKVDREERPDVDDIYMDAVLTMTGSGGWPLNVFLTPDLKPFYGGTYFPPKRMYNMPSWREVLENIHYNYQEHRDKIQEQADHLTAHMKDANNFGNLVSEELKLAGNPFSSEKVEEMIGNLLERADTLNGGFGNAPKFPQTFSLKLLLQHYYHTGRQDCRDIVLLSLDKMSRGGLYDHIGGGFARYSTDAVWLVPHFEKMLYDNALLIDLYAEAFKLTKDEWYARVVRQSIDFVQREMMSDEKGFYSAMDADSEGVEGKYYVWEKSEIDEVLGEDAAIFAAFYGIEEQRNWEEGNILHIRKPLKEFAAEKGMEEKVLAEKLDAASRKLLAIRQNRVHPLTDDKILLSWNALMNASLVNAWKALGEDRYLELAKENMDFLLRAFREPGGREGLMHSYKNQHSSIPGFLDDYANTIRALIRLQEATGHMEYLEEARRLMEVCTDRFSEKGTGFFYYTPFGMEDIIIRKKEIYDNAVPSGNSIMAWNLYYLGVVFDRQDWKERAGLMCSTLERLITKYPSSFGNWGILFQALCYGIPEVVLTGENINELHRILLRNFLPEFVYQTTTKAREDYPLLGKKPVEANPLIFVCRNYTCKKPVGTEEEFLEEMKLH